MERYTVLAAVKECDARNYQADVEQHFDTKKEARAFAKRCVTQEYADSGEMQRLTFSFVYDRVTRETVGEYYV